MRKRPSLLVFPPCRLAAGTVRYPRRMLPDVACTPASSSARFRIRFRAGQPGLLASLPTVYRRSDWFIVFLLVMASVQCIRADFLISESSLNWREYAIGGEMMPYQGRVGMMPILRWAGESPLMQRMAATYARTIFVGSIRTEPITPEKFASMLVGLVAMLATMAGAFWFSRRRGHTTVVADECASCWRSCV